MTDDAAMSRARLNRLAELVDLALQSPPEYQFRLARMLALVVHALRVTARNRWQIGDTSQQRRAIEIEELCCEIEQAARMAGLQITDDQNFR